MIYKLKCSFVIFFVIYYAVNAHPKGREFDNADPICGYKSCPKTPTNKLNIHLVPHSHDDVGWLKTVDQYYYGSNSLVQKAGVQYILDSVVHELIRDKNRRFVWVESAFFFKWYDEQKSELKEEVSRLINEGRLEFIGGAWSMNDEGATHYQSIIDQFTYGLKKLNETFGKCSRPRVGWQIDPFGHSKEMASIFAGMGYDGLFFARLDWKDKTKRLSNKTGEMVWHASENLGKSNDLFTGILANHYSAPPGFCFDYLCNDEPIMDGNDLMERNVEKRLDTFYDYMKNMTEKYLTNNLMIPMGDDFNYQDANMWYKNLDKIIKYSKGREVNGMAVNIFYSTPSCYLKSLHEANKLWPSESNDFFPYSTDPYTYWSGYFTSRPTHKYFERLSNNFLQTSKKLIASKYHHNEYRHLEKNLDPLREAMGIMQHHDAITGTEKEHVAHDYMRILTESLQPLENANQEILKAYVDPDNKIKGRLEFENCFNLNISECRISENSNTFMVTLFNPLSHPIEEYIRIPVGDGNYKVINWEGKNVEVQLISIPETVRNIPGRFSTATNELVFRAKIEKLASYYVFKAEDLKENVVVEVQDYNGMRDNNKDVSQTIQNSNITLILTNGLLTSVKANGIDVNLKQELLYYKGAEGNNAEFKNRSSGAYIFRPNGTAKSFLENGTVKYKIVKGSLVNEIHQIYNEWVSQIIRIYENEMFIEFEWLVGPINISDKIGREIISRFESKDIKSGKVFYTDSNGREMVTRILNDSIKESPIGGNYYPVTARIAIEGTDKNFRMAVLNDRAQGGSSLESGQIELMVHRRLLHDDAFGVGEALNETAYGKGVVARGKHRLHIGKSSASLKADEKYSQQIMLTSPWMFFSSLENVSSIDWAQLNNDIKSLYDEKDIPKSVNLLTLEPFKMNKNEKILLRLENLLEISEGGKTEKFSLNNLINKLNLSSLRETTLDGHQWLDETSRMEFKSKKVREDLNKNKPIYYQFGDYKNNLDIELKPTEIRTFVGLVKKN